MSLTPSSGAASRSACEVPIGSIATRYCRSPCVAPTVVGPGASLSVRAMSRVSAGGGGGAWPLGTPRARHSIFRLGPSSPT